MMQHRGRIRSQQRKNYEKQFQVAANIIGDFELADGRGIDELMDERQRLASRAGIASQEAEIYRAAVDTFKEICHLAMLKGEGYEDIEPRLQEGCALLISTLGDHEQPKLLELSHAMAKQLTDVFATKNVPALP